MTKDRPIIELNNASFHYQDSKQIAVHNLSLTVEKGEFISVLGHNGSGKSTMAKLLNALFLPSDGQVLVAGIDTAGEDAQWDVRRHCGMVFQNPDNQMVATVVEEDVAFGLENLGVAPSEIRRRVDEALEMVGMQDFASRQPHMLSGGQKQRIAIAGVLAMRPDVIVFDEATAMLDPSGRRDVLQIVRRLNKDEGITIIWITHFMTEATLADRVAVMNKGELVMQGTPKQIFTQVDKLDQYGLDVPPMTDLAKQLRDAGMELPEGILSVDEMVVELCRLK
ncbi:energy-coupling factor transporter ATPase [Eubacteriales bacterium OttesenSCG-928-N13]|nr:energy-coupling factor transporter ATPase [Eubacteriales bacterium OttesenSCG-928-N13]